jgi:predicted nucleic acid-binding protein
VTVTIIFDASALISYATLGEGGLTVGEIAGEVADDAAATIAVPVLAVAEARYALDTRGDDLIRLSRLLDPDETPVVSVPVNADDGETLGRIYARLGDLPSAHAALVSLENNNAPILTVHGVRYRSAKLGLDALDL